MKTDFKHVNDKCTLENITYNGDFAYVSAIMKINFRPTNKSKIGDIIKFTVLINGESFAYDSSVLEDKELSIEFILCMAANDIISLEAENETGVNDIEIMSWSIRNI